MSEFPNCKCSSVPEACACENDCPYQNYLVENGFVISCDSCEFAGHADSDGWIGVVNGEGMCSVYCSRKCAGDDFIKWMDENIPNHGFFVDIEE